MSFFQGTLQEGLASAVQQSKLVVCFVADDEPESQQWEGDFLADSSISPAIQSKAVTLRLKGGSEEAGYLSAIYPIPKFPTVVIMASNGQLKDYIAPGVSKADFIRRVAKALGEAVPAPPDVPALSTGNSGSSRTPATETQSSGATGGSTSTSTSSDLAAPAPNQEEQQQQVDPVRAVFAERARRLDAERKKQAEETERRRKEKGKAKADPEQSSQAGKPNTEVQKASQQLKERQREAREARQRILKQIEHDKAERRVREEMRREERRAAAEAAMTEGEEQGEQAGQAIPDIGSPGSTAAATTGRHAQCALQVRLFDGSTLRARFPSSSTLRTEVRQWVDENLGSDNSPYTFRVVFPSRVIDETEEDGTLEALGLTPSSTLILIPVQSANYATAYDDPNVGFVRRLIALVVHIITTIISFFTTIFTTPPRQQADSAELRQQPQQQPGSRVNGLRNPDDTQRDYQLYNGNSLNFEPRKDEGDEDEDRPQ